jgi:hypothetical protein
MVASNNINEMQKIFDTTFYGDSRDVMMMTSGVTKNNGDLREPFDY